MRFGCKPAAHPGSVHQMRHRAFQIRIYGGQKSWSTGPSCGPGRRSGRCHADPRGSIPRRGTLFHRAGPSSVNDPLPMGISVEFKDAHVQSRSTTRSWHVWERDNFAGLQAAQGPGARDGLETIVGFKARERLLDYARLRQGGPAALGLDSASAVYRAGRPRPLAAHAPRTPEQRFMPWKTMFDLFREARSLR